VCKRLKEREPETNNDFVVIKADIGNAVKATGDIEDGSLLAFLLQDLSGCEMNTVDE
jgi:hypothetical protein